MAAAALLVAVQVAYGKFGNGVEFFPNVEPDFGQVIIHGRGNLSLEEKDRVIREVEKHVRATEGLSTVYTRVGEQPRGSSEITEDTIGIIQYEFADWKTRPKAHVIMDSIRAQTANIPGIFVEVNGRKDALPARPPAPGRSHSPCRIARSRTASARRGRRAPIGARWMESGRGGWPGPRLPTETS